MDALPEGAAVAGAEEPACQSVSTSSFPDLLHDLQASLIVSTYQSGRVVVVRAESPTLLHTLFRPFEGPMGIAVHGDSVAIGCARMVWVFFNHPDLAPRIEPAGTYDACLFPRSVQVTGDIRIHEIAFCDGELWIVNTQFSALCTLSSRYSFVPRWKPSFITNLVSEDRCHLNGMAIVDDRVRYVTALGATNGKNGWRDHKADGGVVIDVESGEILLRGLSMPHSPRWYDGRFWFLESGKGTLAAADLETGKVETIIELPGFTRGLAFAGPFAFVGLSQVREKNLFSGIPLLQRVPERVCGVWVVDLRSGSLAAFLRFDAGVQEIFDVQFLHGTRCPELLPLRDDQVATTFHLPAQL